FFGDRKRRDRREDAGVIKRAMQTTEGFHRCCHEIFYLLRDTYIGLDENCLTLLPFDHLCRLEACRIDVADHNFGATTCKQKRCGLSDPTTPACNARNLSNKIE